MSNYKYIQAPEGDKIDAADDGALRVPDEPIIAYVEGDGIGPDIWSAAQHVFESAVRHCYGEKRRIAWMEV